MALAFPSCKKNNVRKIEVNNSFALSLLQDEVSVSELLERMDSTSVEWVRVMPDNTVCAIFYDTIRDAVNGAKLLDRVEDIQIQNSCDVDVPVVEIPAEVAQIWTYDPSYVFEYQIQVDADTMFAVNFAVEQFELNSLVMESGNLAFHVNAAPEQTFPVQVQSAVMQTNEILYNSGNGFEVSLTNPGDVNQDLAGMIIEPLKDLYKDEVRKVGKVLGMDAEHLGIFERRDGDIDQVEAGSTLREAGLGGAEKRVDERFGRALVGGLIGDEEQLLGFTRRAFFDGFVLVVDATDTEQKAQKR